MNAATASPPVNSAVKTKINPKPKDKSMPKSKSRAKTRRTRGKRKKKLTANERMEAAALQGDLQAVLRIMWEDMGEMGMEFFRFQAGQKWLPKTLERLAARRPPALVEAVFQEILSFDARLLFRVQYHIEREMLVSDRRFALRSATCNGPIPDQLAKEWLPRMQALQEAFARTAKSMASVLHTLKLGERGECGERGESGRPGSAKVLKLCAQRKDAAHG